ncbi:MAG: PilZ domain-containing protein [Magnetococcales bacterium]|nr:PilZ domain-containing protein [Magnetococcales bacterium]
MALLSIFGKKKAPAAEAKGNQAAAAAPEKGSDEGAAAIGQAGTQITDADRIYAILLQLMEGQLPIQVFLGDGLIQYYTCMAAPVQAEGGHYLQQRKHLLVAPLEPPKGNEKLVTVDRIRLRFFIERTMMEAQVTFLGLSEDKKLQLSYPQQLIVASQQRAGVRVQVDIEWMPQLQLTVKYADIPAAVKCRLFNVSAGGLAFQPYLALKAPLQPDTKIAVNVTYELAPKGMVIQGIVIDSFPMDEGERCYRVRFMIDSYDMSRKVEELVAWLQRHNLRKRSHLLK